MVKGVEIQGALPTGKTDKTLYIFLYSTSVERAALEAFRQDHLGQPSGLIAWVEDDNSSDPLKRQGIVDALSGGGRTQIVPIGIAWKPKSQSSQSWSKIAAWTRLTESNWRQKLVLKYTPERCVIVIGEAGTRKALRTKFDRFVSIGAGDMDKETNNFADFIALQAGLTIERDARNATGQTIKYPRFVRRSITQRRDYQANLAAIAKESGRSLEDVQTEARTCLDELVPTIRSPHVSFTTVFARKVCGLGYDEGIVFDEAQMKKVRELTMTRPTALLWTHKTHIDGLAMMLATREEDFPLVHTVGGSNMAFFGIGYLMRRSGTIFIRRSIDSEVYKSVMRFYLSYLMEKRFPVSWALEGTRSRNGKLMPPRFGILKYVVEAAAKDNTKDFTIVPISIYYDLIAELGDYAREQTGTTKRKESFAWFMGYLRSLRKPLGRISFGIGEPVTIDTTNKAFTKAVGGDDTQFSIELQKLAFDASVKANAATPMTPSSIIALVLTGAAPRALLAEELIKEAVQIIRWAKARKYPMTEELYDLKGDKVREIARAMIDIGVVDEYQGGHKTVYSINDTKQFEASYYRNTAIHFFVNKAIIEVALAAAAEEDKSQAVDRFWEAVLRLKDLFKFEFFYPDTVTYQNDIKAELARYDPAWEQHLEEGRAKEFLSKMKPHVAHSVLRAFTEAYSIVGDVLLERGDDAVTDKEIIEDCLKRGKQAMLQRRITSEESIGKLMFSNGTKLAVNYGILDAGQIEGRRRFVDVTNNVTRYLQVINAIADEKRASSN